jgi:hypothetical protein
MPDVLYVSPDGARRLVDGELRETLRLEAALDIAQPGQTVRLLRGVYTEPVEIANKAGSFDRPITVRGESGVTFDGRRNLVRPTDGETVDRRSYAFIKILDSQGIILDNFTIQNVWPTAVYIGQSSEIVLRHLNLHGGTYAIYARGERTRRIVAERCAWTGDTTLWDGVVWKDVHMPPFPRRELDGDFFRSVDIPGEVVIRRNMIQHVFNGVHMFARKGLIAANRDVWIYENTFAFIRDNIFESEQFARNWWIFGNRIYNAHKWIAFEESTGGFRYIFSNVGWFDRRPGPPGDLNNGGAVFKENKKGFPTEPTYVFHNTWYLRSTYVKQGRLPGLVHFNNAIVYARSADHPPGLVDDDKPMFGADYLAKWRLKDATPADNASFDNDYCPHPQYRFMARLSGGEPAPGSDKPPKFQNPEGYVFAPDEGSPLLGGGKERTIGLPDGAGPWKIPGGLNLGAFGENDSPIRWTSSAARQTAAGPDRNGQPHETALYPSLRRNPSFPNRDRVSAGGRPRNSVRGRAGSFRGRAAPVLPAFGWCPRRDSPRLAAS